MKEFVTIENKVQIEITEKKSKFIGDLFYIENSQEAEKYIKEIKKKNFDARHHCVAYRTIENGQLIEKFSDDGEPSGTAGAPMLAILQKNHLINVLIVVTRYFGGVLLGTGGLVRAYSNTLLRAIESSSRVEKWEGEELEAVLEYSEFENFKYYCKNNQINISDTQYATNIVCKIEIEDGAKEQFMRDFATKNIKLIDIKELSKKYITKSIKK